MNLKQIQANIGKVVEWQGQHWYLLDGLYREVYSSVYNKSRKMTFAVLGARGQRHEVSARNIKIVEYNSQL